LPTTPWSISPACPRADRQINAVFTHTTATGEYVKKEVFALLVLTCSFTTSEFSSTAIIPWTKYISPLVILTVAESVSKKFLSIRGLKKPVLISVTRG
jgi:hypothetical protein